MPRHIELLRSACITTLTQLQKPFSAQLGVHAACRAAATPLYEIYTLHGISSGLLAHTCCSSLAKVWLRIEPQTLQRGSECRHIGAGRCK